MIVQPVSLGYMSQATDTSSRSVFNSFHYFGKHVDMVQLNILVFLRFPICVSSCILVHEYFDGTQQSTPSLFDYFFEAINFPLFTSVQVQDILRIFSKHPLAVEITTICLILYETLKQILRSVPSRADVADDDIDDNKLVYCRKQFIVLYV